MNDEFFKYSMDLINNMSTDELEARLKEFGFIVERTDQKQNHDGQQSTD